jgi:hypothetical protein
MDCRRSIEVPDIRVRHGLRPISGLTTSRCNGLARRRISSQRGVRFWLEGSISASAIILVREFVLSGPLSSMAGDDEGDRG